MNCYYHNEAGAVAVCQNCGRGLCRECAGEIDGHIACKGKCEPAVKRLYDQVDRSRSITDRNLILGRVMGVVFAVLGALMILSGIYELNLRGFQTSNLFSIIFGLFLFIYGIIWRSFGKRKSQGTA